jgi:hydroxyacylglutathione hydrolase
MYFKQILVGNMRNFSYLFGCPKSRDAAVVDPAFDVEKILKQASTDGYRVTTIFATHSHYDHIGEVGKVVQETGAKIVAHRLEADIGGMNHLSVDRIVEDEDEIKIGQVNVRIIHTPGHTPGGICLLLDDEKLITGDTLFVGDCGRVDLPGGSAQDLYESIQYKLKSLNRDVEVYPGHHYGEKPFSTIGEEIKSNSAMTCRSIEEFRALP